MSMRMSVKKVTLRELDKLGDWKQIMLDKYSEGGSDSEVRAMLRKLRREKSPKNVYRGFGYTTWQRLMKEEPTFKAVVEEGRDASKAWWEDKARMAAIGELKGNPANLIFALKNRAGYTDKQDIKHEGVQMPVFQVITSDGKKELAPPKGKAQSTQPTKH